MKRKLKLPITSHLRVRCALNDVEFFIFSSSHQILKSDLKTMLTFRHETAEEIYHNKKMIEGWNKKVFLRDKGMK